MVCNLREFKEFIDNEMIIILGQMDSPTEIFDHVFLVRIRKVWQRISFWRHGNRSSSFMMSALFERIELRSLNWKILL